LFDQGGLVDARAVRGFPLGSTAGRCVADDDTGRLFVAEAKTAIWRFGAEPDASPVSRTIVDRVGTGHLAGAVRGLALVAQPGRRQLASGLVGRSGLQVRPTEADAAGDGAAVMRPSRRPILVAGLPRSGTTWVGEVLGHTAGARYLHEPDNHLLRPEAWWAKRGLGPYPELAPEQDAPGYEQLWALAFSGGVRP